MALLTSVSAIAEQPPAYPHIGVEYRYAITADEKGKPKWSPGNLLIEKWLGDSWYEVISAERYHNPERFVFNLSHTVALSAVEKPKNRYLTAGAIQREKVEASRRKKMEALRRARAKAESLEAERTAATEAEPARP